MQHNRNHCGQHRNQESGASQYAHADNLHDPGHKHKHKDHFRHALAAMFAVMLLFAVGFMSEGNRITGFAVDDEHEYLMLDAELMQFDDVNSLRTLNEGTYYIANDGTVYWIDSGAKVAVARVAYVEDDKKSRKIFIDDDGNIGYLFQ